MKISCQKEDLLNGLNIAMRAVPSKTPMTILVSFLITVTDKIVITSNDNEMGIETIVDGEISERGKIAIDARLFSEVIRKLPDNVVSIETYTDNKMKISCEDADFMLTGNDGDEFPELPKTENETKIEMSQFLLKEIVRQTIFSVAQGEANALMKGELFEITGQNLKVVSLDSHRISIRKEELAMDYGNVKVIIPGKTLNEISRIIDGELNDTVEILFDRRFIKFAFGKTVVMARLIEGEFFNVEQMISSDYETEIKVNKNDFLKCLDRAITLSREGDKKPIKLDIRDNEMFVDINSSAGYMNERMDIGKNGKDIMIGFNPKFIMDALRVIDDEEISIYMVNSNAPCFIRNEEGSYVYVILPVNIRR